MLGVGVVWVVGWDYQAWVTPSASRRDHLRSLLLLTIYVSMFILATPGMDGMVKYEVGLERLDAQRGKIPEPLLAIGRAGLWTNKFVRVPMASTLAPIQRPLRIEQSWTLYGAGPSNIRRVEIYLDGDLYFRSQDAEYDWLAPQMTYRRLRPMVETMGRKPGATNQSGPVRLAVVFGQRLFAQDGGELTEVEVVVTETPFPDQLRPAPVHHRLIARAPDWEPELIE